MSSVMGSLKESQDVDSIFLKYEEEARKRMRPDGLAQYVDLRKANIENYANLADDPFIEQYGERPWSVPSGLENGRIKAVIIGTGYGGLTYAIRLIQLADFRPEDFIFLDTSSGFGGAWYWNRYPGVMCDVESACYMPLLEETGYIPKHKYSYGTELREYAELLAAKYNLADRAFWRTAVQSASWDDAKSEWVVRFLKGTKTGKKEERTIRTEFVILTAGLLTNPKLPRIPGVDTFKGTIFHTARWPYEITGGSQEDPSLSKLRDKTVAFVGTGATCIQAAPHLAKWSKKLYVFQRTPSAVDTRGQRPIDPHQFRTEVSDSKGWQKRRRENMAMFVEGGKPSIDLVQDGWTEFPSYSALIGGPKAADLTEETLPQYLASLHKIDLPRQERVRKRVKDIVKNPQFADSLTPWYPGWCKRPCFHDDYLDTFNQPNVMLVDTQGQGINSITNDGVIFGGKVYNADVLIYATGFEPVTAGGPSSRASMRIYGRDGAEMEDKWKSGVATLHGLLTHNYPNLFLSGVYQMGSTVNFAHMADVMATHIAKIITQARQKLTSQRSQVPQRLIIEPSVAGEEDWTQKVLATGRAFTTLSGCTPSYATAEGRKARTIEEEARAKRAGNWGIGFLDYAARIEKWDELGEMEGLEIRSIAVH